MSVTSNAAGRRARLSDQTGTGCRRSAGAPAHPGSRAPGRILDETARRRPAGQGRCRVGLALERNDRGCVGLVCTLQLADLVLHAGQDEVGIADSRVRRGLLEHRDRLDRMPDGLVSLPALKRVARLLDEQAAALDGLRGRAEHLAGGAQMQARVVGVALVEQPLGVREVGIAEGMVVVGQFVQGQRPVGEADRLIEVAGRRVAARDRVLGRGA